MTARQGDSRGSGELQRHQQLASHPRRRGAAIGEQTRAVRECLCEAKPRDSALGEGEHHIFNHSRRQGRLNGAHELDHDADRVRAHVW
jgi:hypothetical protein